MKKCPFCKAEIEENARFCLYCMSSLNQKEVIPARKRKKPQWSMIIVAIVAVFLLLAIILPGMQSEDLTLSEDQHLHSAPSSKPTESSVTTAPSSQPVTHPSSQPTSPETQPTTQSTTRPTTKPDTQPTTQPTQPTTQPATEPITVPTGPHTHVYSRRSATAAYLKTDATCTAAAVYYYSCSCGAKGSDTFSYGAKKDHTPVEDVGYAATCLTSGLSNGSHCTVCNTTIKAQTVLSPTGHSLVTDPEVPASCTAPGKTEGSHCKTCNTTIVAQQEIQATGHKYNEPEFGMLITCSVCGALGPSQPAPALSIAKPTLPSVQYGRVRIINCIEKREYNGDGTFDVQLTFTFTNITSSTQVTGIWATLSGIEPSDGRSIELSPGESGTCSVYFYTVPAGNYTIMLE